MFGALKFNFFRLEGIYASYFSSSASMDLLNVDANIVYELSSENTLEQIEFFRLNLFYICAVLGGLTYNMRSCGNFMNRASNFAVDLTLIRKMFTVNRIDDSMYT